MRTVLAQPAFRRLWAARTVSQWGDVFSFVALAILIYRLTGSGLGVAGVVVAEIIPVLLLAPLAGVVVDRLPRIRVMVAADLVRAVLAGVLAVWQDDPVVVYAVAFGLSAGAVFFNPAANSVLPSVVTDREIVAANSATWTAAVLSQIVLAPLAGGLVALVGPGWAFGVNAVSFVASALVLRGLRLTEPPRAVGRRRLLAEAREGVALVGRDRLLRALAIGQLLAAVSAGATSALLVVLAAEHLGAPADAYGLLVAAIGVGAALGPTLLLRWIPDPRRPLYVFGPYVLRGLVDLVLASVRSLPVAAGALAVYGVGTSTGAVTFNSLLQSQVTDRTRGRVFALMDLLWQAGRLVSLGVGGLLADVVGIRAVFYLGGALLLLAAAVGFAASRTPAPPHEVTTGPQ
ncbi:MFS transporter [Geodermatophilus sp. DSM 45219]|uniref:MFS transporter n=1 Tax=Geodermatophilus sp. DSM 45219 TaxID=1881103 RepID=UPI000887BCC8|nr:MFS transporter [Geodermatophilus sp. DSM 45219]SDO37788.1 Predicted arabinose efflux permease, MFS family [Geodermatophilus sp. DSM 45219]